MALADSYLARFAARLHESTPISYGSYPTSARRSEGVDLKGGDILKTEKEKKEKKH